MSARRTYWHLEGEDRKPSEYDITSRRLLFHPHKGLSVSTPAGRFMLSHQGPFVVGDWERFRDPRETTYAKYTQLQAAREIFVQGLFRTEDAPRFDDAWRALVRRVLGPLRFAGHGLQMITSYQGHLAPAGTIVIACALSAADEIRRIQDVTMRWRKLGGDAQESRAAWERDDAWQPLRRCIEELLVAWDFGESFVAHGLVLAPMFDALFGPELARVAANAGDDVTARMLGSLAEDSVWHRAWRIALARIVRAESEENAAHVRRYVEKWRPRALAAIEPFGAWLGADAVTGAMRAHEQVVAAIEANESSR